MYPHRPKAEAFSNIVDVVERLRDPTDPSTERTAPPRSAHIQLDDVPQTLDPVEGEGEVDEDPAARRRGGGSNGDLGRASPSTGRRRSVMGGRGRGQGLGCGCPPSPHYL